MPSELRASKLPQLTKCPGPLFLPTENIMSENAEKAVEWGKMVHYWKETGLVKGPTPRLENALLKAIEVSGIDRTELWPVGGIHEQGVRLAVDGRRLAEPVNKPEEGWLTGTDDFQWWLFDELWIDDLKTGKWYEDPDFEGQNKFPQDPKSAQLKAYALAMATILKYEGSTMVSITHWPRLPRSRRMQKPVRYWHTYTKAELEDFWPVLEQIYRAKIEKDYSALNPGEQCRFCDSRNACLIAKQFSRGDYYGS
jgi:hypothetical protein